jgi:hypothetical protein
MAMEDSNNKPMDVFLVDVALGYRYCGKNIWAESQQILSRLLVDCTGHHTDFARSCRSRQC